MLVNNKNNIEITNDDIRYAEKILLKNGGTFDDERRNFIKNLYTIDLEAVPGSGKTTALLAKLLILERKMPFENGSGILVLSHTNTAVDEIKHKLEKIAPKLFKFPNFIGTIQSFVDTFLAKPYCNSNKIQIKNIDTDIQNNLINNKSYLFRKDINDDNFKKINHIILLSKNIPLEKNKIISSYLEIYNKNIALNFKGKILTKISKPKGNTGKDKYKDYSNQEKEYLIKSIIQFKRNLIKSGNLSFRDSYYLASCYLEKFPQIIKILQKRFKYVFVDEMQDMEQHQVNILEKLFYKKYTLNHCFQRIGDKNQAIYSSINSDEFIDASEKRKILKIEGSHRLTQSIANVVNCFGIERDTKIIGKNKIPNGDIKPIMIVYNDNDLNKETSGENQILKKFGEIILEKQEKGYFKGINSEKLICKAIISNARMHDDGFKQEKCRAKHYFLEYDEDFSKNKTSNWLKSLKDYLYYYDKNDISLNSKYKNILKLFLRILRDNNIENFYRKEQFFSSLQEKHSEKLLEFKDKIYYFCKKLNDNNIEEISKEMDIFFKEFIKNVFNQEVKPGILDSKISIFIVSKNKDIETNIFKYEGLKISVCTTHSVKGETHTCTLYMESSYNYYEIERIEKIKFLGGVNKGLGVYGKRFSKLMYVGFSRPTHLLCFAISKTRFDECFKTNEDIEKLKEYWDIV